MAALEAHLGCKLMVRSTRRLTLTSAAAEKVYRSDGLTSELDIRLSVADGAHLAWLPQETILLFSLRNG